MNLHTGIFALGATQTKSKFASSANLLATSIG